eukprot:517846_1
MTSDSEAKYKGAFWKFIACVLGIACIVLFIAFMIAIYVIITGPPSLDEIQKAHLKQLESTQGDGYKAIVLHEQTEDVKKLSEDNKTFYHVLQVTPDASMEEIAHAYHKLAKSFHPDRNKSPLASKIFVRIAEAYQTLKDPQKRANYDITLKANTHKVQSEPDISMTDAMHIFEIFEQIRQQSSFGPIFGIRFNDQHNPIRAVVPNFPMVMPLLQMMGGMPVQQAYHGQSTDEGGNVVRVTKICHGQRCKMTVIRMERA